MLYPSLNTWPIRCALGPRIQRPTICRRERGLPIFLAGRFGEAGEWAQRALREDPSYTPASAVTAAGHARAGRLQEAQRAMVQLRQVYLALRVTTFTTFIFLAQSTSRPWREGL